MYKGEIWLVDLGGNIGSEQGGIRPCLIVQNDIGNFHSPTTIVCPATTKTKGFSTTHMDVTELLNPSSIMFEQIRVVDKSRVKKYLCTLNEEHILEINNKLMIALGM